MMDSKIVGDSDGNAHPRDASTLFFAASWARKISGGGTSAT